MDSSSAAVEQTASSCSDAKPDIPRSTRPSVIPQISMKPDRDLLDAKFEGYKLSLDSFPIVSVTLPHHVRQIRATDAQWSLQHLKIFAEHNCLHHDRHSSATTTTSDRFFVVLSDLSVYGLQFNFQTKQWSTPIKTARVMVPTDFTNRGDRYMVSISFPTADLALISNGCGLLSLYRTGDRAEFAPWKEILNEKPVSNGVNGKAFVIVNAISNSSTSIECLLHTIIEKAKSDDRTNQSGGLFVSRLIWISLQGDKNDLTWKITRKREIDTYGNIEFVTFDSSAEHIIMASSMSACFTSDSDKPDGLLPLSLKSMPKTEPFTYRWSQTAVDLTAVFPIPEKFTKNDVNFALTADSIQLTLGNDTSLIQGELAGSAQVDRSTWTLDNSTLTLTIVKQDSGRMWTDVVLGDEYGEYVADPQLVSDMIKTVDQFTMENGASNPAPVNETAYNTQELEECDASVNETVIYWLNGETHDIIRESNLGGKQLLFTSRLRTNSPLSACIRYDVDGLLWSFDESDTAVVSHCATFNAFGYVLASKTQRKYANCSPNCSYATIIECNKHALIYWQTESISSDLRNRKSGQRITAIAKQQLMALNDDTGDIIGFYASNNVLFLLTTTAIYAGVLKEDANII